MDADLPTAKDIFKRSNVQPTWEALGRIRADKINFPDEEELEFRLEELRVPELSKVLVWVPFDYFAEVEPLGQGDVYRGTVLWSRGRHAKPQKNGRGEFDIVYDVQDVGSTYALKEVSPLRAAECAPSAYRKRHYERHRTFLDPSDQQVFHGDGIRQHEY
ncbi:hypothetical protein BC936DRAFT_139730 [Jimgerdemannia flammicorona]|uniref:Uncharacterized protein n=1 Tax=Jimgerdemannia flammicorona TaxID=994334 RepID=A0A433B9C9_9FUNG|nr:hypothetical protein BC936DRAFT_139730 [Jimgerdemannia flammicorona]